MRWCQDGSRIGLGALKAMNSVGLEKDTLPGYFPK